jgi:myo-inositol-1(or 4)-monophosphatase
MKTDVDPVQIGSRLGEVVRKASVGLHHRPRVERDGPNPASRWDREVDERLREHLGNLLDVPVLSEEDRSFGPHSEGSCWVIDPIDGTLNAIVGSKDFAVSVALVDLREVRTLAAAVYLPRDDTLFEAIQDGPALRNGNPLEIGKVRLPASDPQIAAFGVPHDALQVADRMANTMRHLMKTGWVTRQTGAATIDICRVATGLWRGFFEFNLLYWDFAAAALIAERAGCDVRTNKVGDATAGDLHLEYDLIVGRNKDMASELEAAMYDDESAKQAAVLAALTGAGASAPTSR